MSAALTRRTILTGALASISLPTRAQEKRHLRVSIIPIVDVAPLFVAVRKGYFANHGIEVDTTPSAGGAAGIPALIAGSFDIAYGNVVSTLLAAQNDLPVRVIAAGTAFATPADDTPGIVVRRESQIKSGRDLEGKTVAVNTRNNGPWLYFRAWIKLTGGNPDRVMFREVPFPQMDDALRSKQVDAVYAVNPYVSVASSRPENELIAHPYTAVQPGMNGGQYVTTAQLLQDRGHDMDAFAKGLRQGIDWFNANRTSSELLQTVSEITRLDPKILRDAPLSPAPARVEPDQMKKTMQLMIENRLLRAPLDVDRLVAPIAL